MWVLLRMHQLLSLLTSLLISLELTPTTSLFLLQFPVNVTPTARIKPGEELTVAMATATGGASASRTLRSSVTSTVTATLTTVSTPAAEEESAANLTLEGSVI